jgi:hypothetical protein
MEFELSSRIKFRVWPEESPKADFLADGVEEKVFPAFEKESSRTRHGAVEPSSLSQEAIAVLLSDSRKRRPA